MKRRHQTSKLRKKLKHGDIPPSSVSDYGQISMSDVLDVICPDVEALTPELCTELVGNGHIMERLLEFKQLGFAYNRARNSFVSEPEFF